jgi:hypothetical protein
MKLYRPALFPSLLGALALGLLCLAGSARASTNLLTSANIMVLQKYPTLVDTNDNINVRGNTGDRRYGILEFDLSGVTPFALGSASLELTCADKAITVASSLQDSYLIDTTGKTQVNGMNWGNYIGDYEGQEYYANETLGVISLPGVAISIGQSDTTVASANDLAQIQAILNSGGKLTIVLKPVNTSSELNWGQNTDLWPGSSLGPSAVLTLMSFATTTELASSANPSVVGNDVTFTTAVQTNGVTANSATGTVVFKDGGTPLSTNNLTGGQAGFSTSALALGLHTIWAEYSGDANYQASTNTLTQLVNLPLPPTTTALVSSGSPSVLGGNVIFTATVMTNGATVGNAGGTMIFMDGFTALSTNSVNDGVTAYTNSTLALGLHVITAQYSGDANYAGSISTTVTQIVLTGTTTMLASSANPSAVGKNVTFSAAVQTNGTTAGNATGTVVFKDGGTPLSTNNLTGGQASFSTSALALGLHTIWAEYSGDSNYGGSLSATVTQSVQTASSVAELIDIPASTDIYIRTLAPDTTFRNDLVSVRNLSGEVRYGVIQFDLSSVMGLVTNVELILDEIGSAQTVTDANFPLVSAAYAIGTSDNVPNLLSMTWNTYEATYEGQEAGVFATLGAYNLPANGTTSANRSTFANAADRAFIQSILDSSGSNVLTLVLKAVNVENAHAFGDGVFAGNAPILRVTTGTNAPPMVAGITAHPVNTTNLPINSTVTLTAAVTGTGPLTYQWQQNAQPLPGATNLSLGLSIEPSMAGNYTLVATGPGGVATSAAVSVTVDAAHAVHDYYASVEVFIRDIAPSTTYHADFLDVRRTIDTTYSPIEVRYGLAQFDLSSLAGQTLSSAQLILDELGSAQGAGASARMPIQTLAFAIATNHNAPNLLSMTWDAYASSYEGLEPEGFGTLGVYDLPANGALRTNRISDANAADIAFLQSLVNTTNQLTLVLKPASPGYDLGHSFGDGLAAGNPAILEVVTSVPTHPPVVSAISVLPGRSDIPVGRDTTLSVTVSGTGTLTYEWRRNGQPIAGATNGTLVLNAIQPDQGGNYTVVVTDLLGSTTSAVAAVTVDASALQIECAQTVWIRDVSPDTTFIGDFLDVRRTTEIRYGLVQFDLSPFAGKTVTGAELILDELGSAQGAGSSATLPIQTVAFAISTNNNAPNLPTMTWNTYQPQYEGQEDFAFTTLGAYDLLANYGIRADRSSFASVPADIALLQQLVDTTNLLTLVLKPTNPGYDIAHSFGDGVTGNRAKLVFATARPTLSATQSGSDLVLSWPEVATGWALQFAPSLNLPVTWTNVDSSTNSNQYLWPASSGSGYFRLTK